MTPQEMIDLRKAGAKRIELNSDGTLKTVEFFTNELTTGFAAAVDSAREDALNDVLSSIEDENTRREVEQRLREKLTYHSS